MSAKKRGPGRPPKSKNKKKPAASSAPARNVHTVPSHFWSQVGAIILAVVTAMLVAGLFGMGGELPVGFANAVRWLVGWTAFVIPVVFAVQIIQVFKQPEDRIPAVIWVTTVIFLALFAGTGRLGCGRRSARLCERTNSCFDICHLDADSADVYLFYFAGRSSPGYP